MAKNKNDLIILQKMKKHCEEIEEYLKAFDYSFDEFETNHLFKNALSMAMFSTQELSNHLSVDFLEKTESEIKWHQLQGMRNYFGHEYEEMDNEIIFNSAINDMSVLSDFLDKEIEKLEELENEEDEEE